MSDLADGSEKATEGGVFGNPDGATADVQRPVGMEMFPRLHISTRRLSTHLIVGRRGAGKTFHWRTLEAESRHRNELISFTDNNALSEVTVKDLSQRMGSSTPDQFWALIWRRAIFSFLASLFYSNQSALAADVTARLKIQVESKRFLSRFEDIFSEPLVFLTSVQYVELFASRYSHRFMDNFLQNQHWGELENVIKLSIPENAPIYVFLDAIDHQAHTMPKIWHDCQCGLFLTILDLIREMGGRLHIVATIRDSVYRSRIATEHGTKIIDDNHIRVLDWGRRENEWFAKQKIAQVIGLGDVSKSSVNDVVAKWLGFSEVLNRRRGRMELTSEYILRHGRCLPRDLVILGNQISRQIDACRRSNIEFTHGFLRKAVETCSELFALEAIETCLTEMMITDESFEEYARILRQNTDDSKTLRIYLKSELEKFIKSIGRQVFEENTLDIALSKIYGGIGKIEDVRYRVDNVLWRNGMLAYLDDRGGGRTSWIYNWYSLSQSEHIPRGQSQYGFHPAITDYYRLEIVKDEFVR